MDRQLDVVEKSLWASTSPAAKGWIAIGAFVVGFDILCDDTLSEGVDRALESHRIATTAAIAYTAMHLLNMLPSNLDLFHHVTTLAKQVRDRM